MTDEVITNFMRATKKYLQSIKVEFDSNTLVEILNMVSKKYTTHIYGGCIDSGWNTRLLNIANKIMK